VLLVLGAVVAAPVEELIVRGHLLMPLVERTKNGALALTGALFGLGHVPYGLSGVLAMTVVGLVLGVVAVNRRSIVAPLVAHIGLNLTAALYFLYVRG
jgi:membrane protease YdiL (CAAX protease family)